MEGGYSFGFGSYVYLSTICRGVGRVLFSGLWARLSHAGVKNFQFKFNFRANGQKSRRQKQKYKNEKYKKKKTERIEKKKFQKE